MQPTSQTTMLGTILEKGAMLSLVIDGLHTSEVGVNFIVSMASGAVHRAGNRPLALL